MKYLATLALILIMGTGAFAQVKKVTLQASGLTCSMCSNSINKALKTLPFAEKVMSNIKTSSFDVYVKPGMAADFDAIKEKVEGAGFFVASMKATVGFEEQAISNDSHVKVDGMTLHFLNVKNKELDGDATVQILDRGYVSAKAFKKNEVYTQMECYKTGVAGSCCAKPGTVKGSRIYHVTI